MENKSFLDSTASDGQAQGTNNTQSASVDYGNVTPITPTSIPAPLSPQQLQAPTPSTSGTAIPQPPKAPKLHLDFKKFGKLGAIIFAALLIIGGVLAVANNVNQSKNANAQLLSADRFGTQQISLSDLNAGTSPALLGTRSLIINGPLIAHDTFTISPSGQPSNATPGQIYYDKGDNELAYFNGTQFVKLTSGVESIGGQSGIVSVGQGLTATNGQITNTGVLSLQGQTGNVTLVAGPGIAINGTTISSTGVTALGGQAGDIAIGNGLSVSGGTLKNTGIISATAGSGITITNDGQGNITISNSGAGSGTVNSPGGTAGRLAKFTGAQTIADSLISESGTTVTVNGDVSVTSGLTLGTALTVGNGGTGTTALAANGVVIGNGAGALSAVTGASPGLCLLSTAGAPAFAACPSASGVTSLDGLSGALTVANSSGAGSTITINDASTTQKGIAQFNSTNFTDNGAGTINTVQNINTGATPTFAGVNTNSINPSAALTVGATGQAFTLQGTSGSVINATSGVNTTTIAFQAPTANVTYRFAAAALGTYDICTMVGNCAGVGGGVTTSGGTPGTLPVFTGAQAIGDSLVSQAAGTVTVNGNLSLSSGHTYQINGTQISSANLSNDSNLAKLNATQTFTGTTNTFQNAADSALAFSIQNASSQKIFSINTTSGTAILGQSSALGGQLVFDNATNANTVTIVASAPTASRTYTLPDVGGNANFCLSTGNCGGAGVTLQTAYNNSTSPEITVDATRGALTIRDAATPIGANLLEVQDNTGATTYFAVTSSGTSTTGSSTTSGNINTTGGGLQTNSTTRVDNSGNLTNIGNITGTGAITIASTGVGNNVTIDGANQFVVQDASVFNAQTTFNASVSLALANTQNLSITNTVTGTNSVDLISAILTNNSTSGTQNIAKLQNAAGSGTTEGLLVLDNADATHAVTSGLQITSAAGGVTNAIDVSDPDIVTALLFGANDIVGTNFSVTGASGDITSAGNATLQGGVATVGTSSQAGSLVISDGSSNTGTLQVTSLAANRVYTLPDATGTICLNTGNCAGAGVTLQSAYDNSTSPEIVLNSTNGALTLRDNATPLGANLFEVQNNAGSTTYFDVTASGIAVTGTASATGNINSSGGALQTAGTTRVDNSGNLTNIGSLTLSGAISGGTTYSGSGNINTSSGALQTAGTTRVDNTGNLLNIGNLTATGAITIASTGAGHDIVLNSANTIQLQNNTTVTGTLTSTGNATVQGGTITIGTTTQSGLVAISDGSSNTGSIVTAALAADRTYTLPDQTGTICLSTGNCAGAGVTLQSAYNNSTSPEIVLNSTNGALTLRDAATPIGANLLEVQDNAGTTTYLAVTSSGASVTGTTSSTGNINSSGGALQTNGTTRVDNSGNLTNIGSLTLSGAISGGTTYSGSGNINTSGGALQTAGTSRVDNTGNLINIGNITGSGAVTIASTGAGNNVTIDGANQFVVQDAAVFNSTSTFNNSVSLALANTQNLSITNTVTGTNAVNLIGAVLTNNTTSGTQQVALLQNAAGSGTTEGLLVLDNADATHAVTSGLQITSAAGGITNAIDVSDPDIVTALLFGANDIVGTNFSVTGSSGNFTSAGNGTIQGGTVTVGTTSQQGVLTLHDGNGQTATLSVGSALAANTTIAIPTAVGASDTVCLLTLANCVGTGGGISGSGTSNTLAKFTGGSSIGDSTISDDGTNVTTSIDLIVQGGDLTMGVASSQTGSIAFKHSGSANTGTITQGALTGSRTYTLPDVSGTFCTTAGNCSGTGSSNTLQAAYDAGNTITTTDARDISITLADTTTDSNFAISTATGSTSYVSITRADGAGTADPAQLLLINNNDTDRAQPVGIAVQAAAGGITTAFDASGANITNALAIGAHAITGTNFSVTSGGAITAVGVNSGTGLIQGTGGLTVSGAAISLNASSNNNTNINTGTSTGTITIGGGSSPLVIDSTNFDVSSAGAVSGVTTLSTSSTITVGALGANTGSSSICRNSSNQISSCSGAGGIDANVTLQNAYANGNSISTTDARDIALTLADTTTDGNFTITTATGSTGFTSFLRADGAGTADPAQLVLVKNNDVDRAQPLGISVQAAAGGITTAFDASGANITNALAIGAHAITGTNFSVTGGGAVTAVGVNSGTGLIQGTGGLTVTGAVSVNNNSNNNVSINTGSSTGTVTIGGGSAPLVIDSTNFDVSSAGAVSGVTTLSTSSTITVGALGANTGSSSICRNSSNQISSCSGSGGIDANVTLQNAYNNGAGITTTDARDIALTLADTTTDSNFTITTATGSTGFTSIVRADGAGTADPAQLLLVKNNDIDRAQPVGISVQSAAGGVTTAFDASGANITNALAIGAHAITGTNFSVTGGGAVTAVGVNSGTGLIQGTGGLTVTGAVSINNNSNNNVSINTGSSTGTVTIGGGSAPLVIDSTNFDVSSAGAVSGVTTLSTSSTITVGALGANTGSSSICRNSSNQISSCSGAGGIDAAVTLQNAYANGNGITTTDARDINLTLADTTTDSNLTITTATGATGFTSFLRADGSGTADPAQLVLIKNNDVDRVQPIGLALQSAAGGLTTAIDASGANITNALSVGANAITGTTGNITYTNFGVTGSNGNINTAGTLTLGTLGTTNTATYLCRNASNILAACNTTGTGAAFVQGGNSFGATAVLGTNDNNGINIVTNGSTIGTISATGGVTLTNTSNSTTAFNVRTNGPNNVFTVDTQNARVGINLSGSTTPTLANGGLELHGGIRMSGTGGFDSYTTPLGASYNAKLNIANDDPGSFGQLIAAGLTATAQSTSRALTLFDARATAHQPTLAVFDPNEANIIGLSWNGSTTTGYLMTNDLTSGGNTAGVAVSSGAVSGGNGSSGTLTLQSGNISGGTGFSTGAVFIASGDGLGTNSSSGSVSIDSGSKTGSGTNGTVTIGATNASSVNIGRTASPVVINGSNLLLNSAGVVTMVGGQTKDLTTAAASTATNLTFKPGDSTGNNVTGASTTLSAGDTTTGTCGTACTAGSLTLQGGSATNGSGVRNGGNVNIDAGTGNTANGTINIGTVNSSNITIGKTTGGSSTLVQAGSGNVELEAQGASTTGIIQIGAGGAGSTTPDYLALDVKSTTGDPAGGVEGEMYYNTFDNKFRCFQGSAWTDCIASGGTVTLQTAYGNGNTITTTDARDIAFTLADTTTDSNFTVTTATGSTGFTSFLRADGAGTADPAQLVLVKNNDIDRVQPVGISVQSAAGGITTAFDASGSNITTALAIGAHAITGTNFNVSSAGVITLAGGQTADITTANAAAATALTIKPGDTSNANGTGAGTTLKAGDATSTSCGTACAGGALTLQGGSATGASGTTRNGGAVSIDGGTGATANGAINIGTNVDSAVTIGKSNGTSILTFGQSTGNETINIGNATIATGNTETIAIGTSATGTGKTATTIGSTNGASSVSLQSGTGGITMIGGGATAFQMQNASGDRLLTVNSTSNQVELGKPSVRDGNLVFNNGTNNNTITLIPATGASGTLTLPAETGTLCSTASVCSGYQASSTAIIQVPGSTAQNTITPTTNSVVGLTVNGTSGTSAVAAIFNQANNTSPADTVQVNSTNTSGTQTNGLLFNRNGTGGTTTNGINITQNAGTLTNGLSFTGTIGTDINRGSGTLSVQGGGGVSIQAAASQTISLGTTNDNVITLGNTSATNTLTLGQSTATNTINIGNGTIAAGNTETINIGTSSTSTGKTAITIGSTNDGSSLALQAGTGNLSLATNSASASIIAKSNTNGTSAFEVQNASGSSLITVDTTNTALIIGPGESGTPAAMKVRGAAASGSNIPGADLTFDASNGTGSSGSGAFIFRTAPGAVASVSNLSPSNTTDAACTPPGPPTCTPTFTYSTLSYTIGSESNRLLLVGINTNSTVGTRTVASVSYGGVAMTQLTSQNCAAGGNFCRTELWYLKDASLPAAGAHTFSIVYNNASGTLNYGANAVELYNVDQTTTFASQATNSGNGTTASVTVTGTNTNQMVLDFPAGQGDTFTPNAAQTQLWHKNNQSDTGAASKRTGVLGNTTMSWTLATDPWAEIGIAVNPGTNTTADTLAERVRIDQNGNVGIGTSSPSATLHVDGTGIFQSASNSTTSFQVQNSSGAALLTADTTNERLYVGPTAGDTTGALLVLGNKTTYTSGAQVGDPTGVAGAMYYNSSLGQFRCYEVDHWRDCLASARTQFYYTNDLTTTNTDSVIGFGNSGTTGAGNFGNSFAATAQHPGIVEQATGTNSAGWALIGSGDANGQSILLGNNDYWRYETDVHVENASSTTQRYVYRAGFSDASGGNNDPTDGCIFKYSDNVNTGKWQGACFNGGTSSTCDTGTSVATATWYRLTVVVNAAGTSVDFQINGVSKCQVTTNIPTTTGHTTTWQDSLAKTVGTTNASITVDYVELLGQLGTAR